MYSQYSSPTFLTHFRSRKGFLLLFLKNVVFLEDNSQNKRVLVTIWVALAAIQLGLLLQGVDLLKYSIINVIFLINICLLSAFFGLWASIQFHWFQSEYPQLTIVTLAQIFLFNTLMIEKKRCLKGSSFPRTFTPVSYS